MERADDLAAMTVLDERGQAVPLGPLWRDRTAVLVFIRHFGCLHCRDHVVQLHRRIDELRAPGADVIVIGNGTPNFIDGFRETTGWRGSIYTDPSLAVYKAAGLKRGVLRTLDPRGALRGIATLSRGIRQGRTQGDQWQQGGVLVVATSGDVLWSQASDGPGDNATVDEILSAIATRAA